MNKNDVNTTLEYDDIPQEWLKAINKRNARRKAINKRMNDVHVKNINTRWNFACIMFFVFGCVCAVCGFLAGLLF